MKVRSIYIIIAVILFFVILLVTSSGCGNFIPYSDAIFRKEFPYEGLANMMAPSADKKQSSQPALKVEGFESLMPAPYDKVEMIDVFFNTESRPDCQGSNLTKGSGGVCLSPEQVSLLRTRGKNSTGGDSQIGN